MLGALARECVWFSVCITTTSIVVVVVVVRSRCRRQRRCFVALRVCMRVRCVGVGNVVIVVARMSTDVRVGGSSSAFVCVCGACWVYEFARSCEFVAVACTDSVCTESECVHASQRVFSASCIYSSTENDTNPSHVMFSVLCGMCAPSATS